VSKEWMNSCSFTLVDSKEKLTYLKTQIESAQFVGLDLETTGLDWLSDWIVGVAISTGEDQGYYIPIDHKDSNNLSIALVKQELHEILLKKKVIYFNAAFDRSMLIKADMDVPGEDAMLLIYHKNTEKYKAVGLKKASKEFLNREMIEFKDLFTDEEKKRVDRKVPSLKLNKKPATDCLAYACSDAINTWLLYKKERHRLPPRMESVYEIDNKFIDYILAIQDTGFDVDLKYLSELRKRIQGKISMLQDRMNAAAGFEVNPNASASIWKALTSFGVEPTKFTEKSNKPAFDADTLDGVDHPFAKDVSDYKILTKTLSTYIDALEQGIHPKTGRCHSLYPYTFTSTGRLSSTAMKDTNMKKLGINAQQVAKMIISDSKHEFFQEFKSDSIRKAIIPPKGYILGSLDWSAVELRIAAHFSQEPIWLEGFRKNEDLHQKLADTINNKLGLNIDRTKAKNAQFNMLYAFYWSTFAENQGISMEEAEMLYKAFFSTVVYYDRWRESYKKQAYTQGYSETMYGRRRVVGSYAEARDLQNYLKNLDKKYENYSREEKSLYRQYRMKRSQGDREAINHRVQGTCLDFMKIAGIKICKEMAREGLWRTDVIPMMVVHDEANFAVKGEILTIDRSGTDPLVIVSPEATANLAKIKKIMENVAPANFSVPLVCEVEAGLNWKELYKLKV